MPPVQLNPEAQADLVDAFAWYEGQREGLGSEFLAAIAHTLTNIENAPLRYPVLLGETRRALVRHFPYGIFFVVDPEVAVVTAVMHARRDPQRWRTRR